MTQAVFAETEAAQELDELDVEEADLDDYGDADVDDDLEGLSSDLDNWVEDDLYGGYSDRDYINGLFR